MTHSDNPTSGASSLESASNEVFPGIDQPVDPILHTEVLENPNIRLGVD